MSLEFSNNQGPTQQYVLVKSLILTDIDRLFALQTPTFLNGVNCVSANVGDGTCKVLVVLFHCVVFLTCTSRWPQTQGQNNMFLNHLLK